MWVRCLLMVALLLATPSHAALFDRDGLKVPDKDANSKSVAWRVLRKKRDKITGVGVLGYPWAGDFCTATLLDTKVKSGPAYILTNAHCLLLDHWGFDFMKPHEHRVDVATDYYVRFNHFVHVKRRKRKKFEIENVAYMTENGTDVAILKLKSRLGELTDAGFKPLKLRSKPIKPNEKISVRLIGIPLEYLPAKRQSLHMSHCETGKVVKLKNGSYTAPKSVRHKCSSIKGFSGGPLLAENDEIVLLNSHGAADDSKEADCSYASRPCEVPENGKPFVNPNANYAQYVHSIAGCFNQNGEFELELATCGLPKD